MAPIIKEFEDLRTSIIKDSPKTPNERILYIKSVLVCGELITEMMDSKDNDIREYMSKKMGLNVGT